MSVKRTIKQINQFRPDTHIIDNDGSTLVKRNTAKMSVDDNGFYSLSPGTYEVVFNEYWTGEMPSVLPSFMSNGVIFYKYTYISDDGTATLMTVHNGYLKIRPGTVVAYGGEIEDQEPKRRGRPPKNKDEGLNNEI